jgi:hypothetical protein
MNRELQEEFMMYYKDYKLRRYSWV